MATYNMSFEQAVDIPSEIAERLLLCSVKRQKFELEYQSVMFANSIGKMLFGSKDSKGSTSTTTNTGGKTPMKSAYSSGGRTSTKPDLRPNPSRPRLKELSEMEPQPLDMFALSMLSGIKQSVIPGK